MSNKQRVKNTIEFVRAQHAELQSRKTLHYYKGKDAID